MRQYEYLIFATGAVTLALEVMASQIIIPYFGVILSIWTGILSIILTFLALGYHLGGSNFRRADRASLEGLFLAAPVLSAISIAIAVAVYPILFLTLSQFKLIAGSFAGATLLLALPLIALSDMIPLLIGLQRARTEDRGNRSSGDAGAGGLKGAKTVVDPLGPRGRADLRWAPGGPGQLFETRCRRHRSKPDIRDPRRIYVGVGQCEGG